MPALNWDNFKVLPGSPEKNFELLCRGIVRQNFGSYGGLRALMNQPGVEFHLKLDRWCDALGGSDRWWGWQCKWYTLPASKALGTGRRNDIENGIRKSEAHLPDLTDWVLWMPQTLTKADQAWFHGLSSTMTLHLWTGDEVDNLLSGQASVLRSTYFGELVLTPDMLQEQYEQSVAAVQSRWQPDVHQVRDVEHQLRRMLAELEPWGVLGTLAADLQGSVKALEAASQMSSPLESFSTDVIASSRQSSDILSEVAESIRNGDLDLLRDELNSRPRTLPENVMIAPRKLRSGNHRAAPYAANAVASCRDSLRALDDVEQSFSSRVVAVVASAGFGKTHLAAQLSTETAERPHGILLYGRDLHANYTLNDLAQRVSIAAKPIQSMESLLAALDAAGQRARRRLPLVIDGLNEAEDPRLWKSQLASIETMLTRYPYVLVVCTLRPEFIDETLPEGTLCLELKDYGENIKEAIHKHFHHWKIDATDAIVPSFLRHPLTLRIFCEVTNPTRQEIVSINETQSSLAALFERYLEQVASRVVELAPREHRFYAQDVTQAISKLANKLWESRSRSIELDELRNLLSDAQRPWDQSLVRALEHEGVLLRISSNALVPVYDLLGGHIISDAILSKHGLSGFETWIREPSAISLLTGEHNLRHPLADDIVLSLVEQLPRRFHARQLWQIVDEPLQEVALRSAARLQPALLDTETVNALLKLVHEGDSQLFVRLQEVRGASLHPLNAEALDRVLRTMLVSDRDLKWTEWLRKNHDEVLRDLKRLGKRWRLKQKYSGDRLRAQWVMWTLTSTVRQLRDQATNTLYWFGRIYPEALFELTIDSLALNDAYVSERMLAASYGIVMSHQSAATDDFDSPLRQFLELLSAALVGVSATSPTHHYLSQIYVRGIVAFSGKFYPCTLPTSLTGEWSFTPPATVQPLGQGDAGADEAGQTLHTDFKNYTLGRLFNDRKNYDMNHAGHQSAVAHVRGVVWTLGWRKKTFEAIDRAISESSYQHGRSGPSSVERYGKKYGWIGYNTFAGLLKESGQFPQDNRLFPDVNIDPSFPEEPPIDGDASTLEAWLSPTVESHEDWVCSSTTALPLSFIRRDTIGGHHGPWIAVHGHVNAYDMVLGRYARAFISALVVSKESAPQLEVALKEGALFRSTHEVPSDYDIYAGEIPWHPNFAALALAENAYLESVRVGAETVEIEVLAHEYAWEGYHSEMNRAGSVRVPSQPFSRHFDLRSIAQAFDQILPNGSRATITLSGIDGLKGNLLYIREDLLQQYVDGRTILWSAFGERELRPYPAVPPNWLLEAQRKQANAWQQVITEQEIKLIGAAGS